MFGDVIMDMSSNDFWKGLKERDESLMGLEPFNVRYSDKEIKELANTLKWKGTGIKDDPIIIPDSEGLPQKFSILTSTLFIHILNSKFTHIILAKSQNISIENCTFEILGIYKSSNLNIIDSTISKLNLDRCSNNYFKNCSIAKAFNLKSQANTFENCALTNEVVTILQESYFNLSRFVKQFPYVILIAGIGISIFTIIHIIDSVPFGFNWFLMIGAFFCLVLLYLILLKNQKKSIPNKILIKNSKKSI